MSDSITIKNIKGFKELSATFEFNQSSIIVITGKNGTGKTTLVSALNVLNEPDTFENTSSYKSISQSSSIHFNLEGYKPFSFKYNPELGVLDSKDKLPPSGKVIAELPIPNGIRFKRFNELFSRNSEITASNASKSYVTASELIVFLHEIYGGSKFSELKSVKIGSDYFYFIPKESGTYLREDNLSSGEYFLIQIFKLISSGAELVVIDEIDVAIDAAAQVRLYNAIKPILEKYKTKLILISHSLAFMSTVDDGSLYYIENHKESITLERRSFSYIRSDLYGFRGYDRYILTEDVVLEGFIEYLFKYYSIVPYFQHRTIGVAGWNQLKMIVEKNDEAEIFSDPQNVMCIVDGDAYSQLSTNYKGPTLISSSPIMDLEKYLYLNRNGLLSHVPLPEYTESTDTKKASKAYWRYLTKDRKIPLNKLYTIVIENNEENVQCLVADVKAFLIPDE